MSDSWWYDFEHSSSPSVDLPRLKHTKTTRFQSTQRQALVGRHSPPSSEGSVPYIPVEVLTDILSRYFYTLFDDGKIESFTNSFVPVRFMLNGTHNPFAYASRILRDISLEIVLSSLKARNGSLVGMTVREAVQIRQWFPDLRLRGVLLFLGDPNDLLVGPLADNPNIAPLISDLILVTSVEAIEWDDPSTSEQDLKPSPGVDAFMLDALEELPEHSERMEASLEALYGDHSEDYRNAHILHTETISMAMVLSSKIFKAFDFFPNLKTTEIPTWAFLLTWGISCYSEVDAGHTTARLLGELPVTRVQLRQQFQALINRLDKLMIAGYRLALQDIIPDESERDRWLDYLGDYPGSKFIFQRNACRWEQDMEYSFGPPEGDTPPLNFSGLKALGWRSETQQSPIYHETLSLLQDVLTSSTMSVPLEELYVVTSGQDIHIAPEYPILSLPFLQSAGTTLRKLVLHFSCEQYRMFGIATPSPHHCSVMSSFDKLLPNIEDLDVSLDSLCQQFFNGVCRPQKTNGKLVLTLRHDCLKASCSDTFENFDIPHHSGHRRPRCFQQSSLARTGLDILDASIPHFQHMQDWDVKILLETDFVMKRGKLEKLHVSEEHQTSVFRVENTLVLSPFSNTIKLYNNVKKRVAVTPEKPHEPGRPGYIWDERVYETSRGDLDYWAVRVGQELGSQHDSDPGWGTKRWEHWLMYPGWGLDQ